VLTLPSNLTHDFSAGFARGLSPMVLAQPAEVVADASTLQTFDSSALTVLLACRREAIAAGKTFSVHGLPSRLRQLAGLYGVAELIPQTA
jgi:phospholipid transport system transporter-binding protein